MTTGLVGADEERQSYFLFKKSFYQQHSEARGNSGFMEAHRAFKRNCMVGRFDVPASTLHRKGL